MKMRDALQTARKIASSRVTITPHYGDPANKRIDRAVRISGCFQRDARPIAAEIARALNRDGNQRISAGFVCVWL